MLRGNPGQLGCLASCYIFIIMGLNILQNTVQPMKLRLYILGCAVVERSEQFCEQLLQGEGLAFLRLVPATEQTGGQRAHLGRAGMNRSHAVKRTGKGVIRRDGGIFDPYALQIRTLLQGEVDGAVTAYNTARGQLA